MATNKHALIRYKILDRCFANPGKRYFIDDLIEACSQAMDEIKEDNSGISRRQVLDDIKFMESPEGWNVELERTRDNRRVFYRYVDPAFSINNMPLNETEINHLNEAVNVLAQFKGMPKFEWLQEMLPKLKQGAQTEPDVIIDFDTNPFLKGLEHLGILYNAVHYKKVLKINYQPYEQEMSYEVELHPYFLKQYNNRWFLFGYNPLNEKSDWNLAIDRIAGIKEIKGRYKKNEINWQEYFDDMIGVTKTAGEETQEVVLHFYGRQGKYVETKPIHGSQRTKWIDNSTLEVRLLLMLNYELERLILSYADGVKVVKPKSLINKIEKRLSGAVKNYE